MRQIRDKIIIEIDITNACHKTCSNCTRFCGHHKKPYYMDFETFMRAIDSLDGYEGLISTIGGEPLLHPEYSIFAEYLQSKRNYKGIRNKSIDGTRSKAILNDYLGFAITQRWIDGALNRGKGYSLFTSIPKNYYKQYETVQDTVTDLWLNDHTAASMHQPILISRKDLGITDEEFAGLRDKCWLQNFWSGSITPKGCFFCEVAGTLDILFDGDGGKPIAKGWWNKDISEFSDQFHWCDICGMALKTFSRNANEGIDDASPTLYEKLKVMNTPKFRKQQVNLVSPDKIGGEGLGKDMASVMGNYQPINEVRVGNVKTNMQPGKLLEALSLGIELARTARKCELRDWVLYKEENANLPNNFAQLICERYLNPGYLFVCRFGTGQAVLFSPISKAAKSLGFDGLRDCKSINELVSKWGDKVHYLEQGFESLPDIDIPYFRNKVFENYDCDEDFKARLKERLISQNVPAKGNILVLQSAFVFHTLSIVRLLKNMGYEIWVITNNKFTEYFDFWLDNSRIFEFSETSHYDFATQGQFRKHIKSLISFDGAIVPFSFGHSTVKYVDDYTDALQTATDIGGKILGIINIRRKFIEPEYNIWEV